MISFGADQGWAGGSIQSFSIESWNSNTISRRTARGKRPEREQRFTYETASGWSARSSGTVFRNFSIYVAGERAHSRLPSCSCPCSRSFARSLARDFLSAFNCGSPAGYPAPDRGPRESWPATLQVSPSHSAKWRARQKRVALTRFANAI